MTESTKELFNFVELKSRLPKFLLSRYCLHFEPTKIKICLPTIFRAESFLFVDYIPEISDEESKGIGIESLGKLERAFIWKEFINPDKIKNISLCIVKIEKNAYESARHIIYNLPNKIRLLYGNEARREYDRACEMLSKMLMLDEGPGIIRKIHKDSEKIAE